MKSNFVHLSLPFLPFSPLPVYICFVVVFFFFRPLLTKVPSSTSLGRWVGRWKQKQLCASPEAKVIFMPHSCPTFPTSHRKSIGVTKSVNFWKPKNTTDWSSVDTRCYPRLLQNQRSRSRNRSAGFLYLLLLIRFKRVKSAKKAYCDSLIDR